MFTYQAYSGSRHALPLDKVAKSAHGERAIGSDRNQQDSVYAISFQVPGQFSCGWLQFFDLRGAHKRIVTIGNAADNTAVSQFM